MNQQDALTEAVEQLDEVARNALSNGEGDYATHLYAVTEALSTMLTPEGHYRLSDLTIPAAVQQRIDSTTDPRFWDCECAEVYIHSKSIDTYCPLCKADQFHDVHPDARVLEIAQGGKFATDDSWLIAYNMSEYYDSLDHYDIQRSRKGAEIASIEAIAIFRSQA